MQNLIAVRSTRIVLFHSKITYPVNPTDSSINSSLPSAPNCHPECNGCSESRSAVSCFSCKHLTQSLRNRAGFKCVKRCDEGYFLEGDKCRACSPNCKSCIKAEQCETCPGVQLLIDVNHYGHLDHGQCVDECPQGLEPDYTISVQARCVLKKNKCLIGYYEAINLVCTPCDNACRACHGPGPLQCDSCADNFSNKSVGYCRPCCAANDDPMLHHCEDCTAISLHENKIEQVGSSVFTVLCFAIIFVLIFVLITALIMKIINENFLNRDGRNIDYVPLPAEQQVDSSTDATDSDSDDECSNDGCDGLII
ncbi:unnamed protein product [Thelazia callipaeda]|uniref:Furin-like_2 domain-containing protein n=1 Tax=Thelazia callipaeda TaxID=103827 RepID=A0A0N5CUW2_THECL|nr:unnamed protein product [Thelazia callipaeda]